MIGRSLSCPVHPFLVAAAFVLNGWIDYGVSPSAIGRAFLVAQLIALVLTVAGSVTLWSIQRGALVATICLVAIIADVSPVSAVVVAWLTIAASWVLERLGRGVPLERINRAANVGALALTIVLAGSWLAAGGPLQLVHDLSRRPVTIVETDPNYPDIYLILLDAHARADWLDDVFSYDATPFLRGLEDRGFDVYPTTNSNYDSTSLTLASMFNMNYLDDVTELRDVREGKSPIQPHLRNAISSGRAFDVLHEHRYAVVSISAGWEELSLRQADEFVDVGDFNEFEQILMETTGIARVIDGWDHDFFGRQVRGRVVANLQALVDQTRVERKQPRFVFVHIPSPHYPAVFDASGGARQVSLDGLYEYVPSNTSDAILAATYAGQVEALDRMVLATIDALSEPGRPRAIVIFSDHGSLTALGGEQERLSNFLAANTPGANELFGEEPSPVNLLRALFAHYLGEPTDPLPFHAYRTTEMTGLRFREVDIEGRD